MQRLLSLKAALKDLEQRLHLELKRPKPDDTLVRALKLKRLALSQSLDSFAKQAAA